MHNMPELIDENEIYGYHFAGETVLVIRMSEDEALSYLKAQRGRTAVVFHAETEPAFSVLDEIFFQTEETWYQTRFHRFGIEENGFSFELYFLKAAYMASADLLQYRKKTRSFDDQNREYVWFSDKVQHAGSHTEQSSDRDVVGIVDTADDADESFGDGR